MALQRLFLPPSQLRIEGLAQFALAVGFYHVIAGNWIGFVVLFLAPDLSWLGYLAGNQVGAVVYNVAHNNALPPALALAGFVAGDALLMSLALIWLARIGGDRLFGFGLKADSSLWAVNYATPLPFRTQLKKGLEVRIFAGSLGLL